MGHPMNRALRWLWAAAAAGLFAAADVALVLKEPAAELIVEMKASETSRAKVFFHTGEGFTESDSVTRLIPADSVVHRLSFPLPAKPVHSIRFDPLEFSGVVQIRSLSIWKPDSNVELARLVSAKVAALSEIASLTRAGEALAFKPVDPAGDPQLLLPSEQPLRIEHAATDRFSLRNRGTTALFLMLALAAAAVALWWPKV